MFNNRIICRTFFFSDILLLLCIFTRKVIVRENHGEGWAHGTRLSLQNPVPPCCICRQNLRYCRRFVLSENNNYCAPNTPSEYLSEYSLFLDNIIFSNNCREILSFAYAYASCTVHYNDMYWICMILAYSRLQS